MKRLDWVKSIGLIIGLVLGVTSSISAQGVQENPLEGNINTPEDGMHLGVDSSLRNDLAVKRMDNNEKTPLAYQRIRSKDAVWGKRVWEEIDTRQKMNQPFVYKGHDEKGNSLMLIDILVNAVLDSEVTAFKGVDDRFTTPLTVAQVQGELTGKADTISVTDPVTGEVTQKVIRNDFDPQSVKTYRLKEDWVFDRQTSRLYCRIIGIAPLQDIVDPNTGELRGKMPLFWIYYPDLRSVLAKYDVYNPNNYYQRISWEDLFEMRRFNGHIVKVDNALDETIEQEIPGTSTEAGIKRLLKGKKVHNKIFNFEQNLWEY